jgi:PEP-CTERM motif
MNASKSVHAFCVATVVFSTLVFRSQSDARAVAPGPDSVDSWDSSDGPTYYFAPQGGSIDVHILGVYQGGNPAIQTVQPIQVNILPPIGGTMVPLDLVLSSYLSVNWQLNILPGANINEIVLNGFDQQSVTGAGAVTVVNKSPFLNNWFGAYGYQWPSATGGSNTPLLVQNVQSFFGTSISQFAGVYAGNEFTVRGELAPVPEPSTLTLLALGVVGLAVMRRRR